MLCELSLLVQLAVPLGPEIPAGTHEAFLKTCIAVERKLSAGKFSEATQLTTRLPKRNVVISYEDSAVSAGDRKQYRDAVTRATANWSKALTGLKFTFAAKGDIKISFSKRDMAISTESGLPAGAAFFVSDSANEPRVEAVFALVRGKDKLPSNRKDVYNETAFAIGTYLGVASSPAWGEVMHRTDSPSGIETRIVGAGLALARQCLGIADELRLAAKNKKPMQVAIPELALEKTELAPPTTLQGDEAQSSFAITNNGTTTLRYSIVPECGCFTLKYGGILKSGETGVVRVAVNTEAFTGDFRKHLTLYSNDPEQPAKIIPVKFYIDPRYRFLFDHPKPVYIVGDSGLALPIYLARGKGSQFKVKSYDLSGTTAQMEMSEWSGRMADLAVGNTTPQDWTGYKFSLLISPNISTGRAPITLTVVTDDPVFPEIRQTIYVQRGIVAFPQSIYLGQISKDPQKINFSVSRPGQPFVIKRIESNAKCFSAQFKALGKGDEYAVIVDYNGEVDFGNLQATLTIFTDDPKQPKILVPIAGVIQ